MNLACPPNVPLPENRQEEFQDIAVVGAGVSGLAAAWLLARAGHRVTLYEQNAWIGGHAHTVEAPLAGAPDSTASSSLSGSQTVDVGFIVYNEQTYPNLTALFQHLEVRTRPGCMSLAISLEGGGLEYSGNSWGGLLAQKRNLLRPRFWSMVSDLRRWFRQPHPTEDHPTEDDGQALDQPLAEYLRARGFGSAMLHDHLLPMGAAIWSATPDTIAEMPARVFMQFLENHGLLRLRDRPQWRTVAGGSREYVGRMCRSLEGCIRHLPIRRVLRTGTSVELVDEAGERARHDAVVLAVHPDQALALLDGPTAQEQALLGVWRYSENRVVLHRDAALMPRRRRVWSGWNVVGDRAGVLCVSYWMNRLQSIAGPDLFVTLNPLVEPAADSLIGGFGVRHPVLDRDSVASRSLLWGLQGQQRTWYAGSWFGAGFHEDGLQAGLAVAEQLGRCRRPWHVAGESGRIHVWSRLESVA